MTMAIDPAAFRSAMSRFPGAVTIITTRVPQERRGITATAVCSVTAEPPSLLICVNRETGTCLGIHETGRFNVNLLADPADDLALRFAGVGGHTGEAKFDLGDWHVDARGVPVLGSALMAFSCDVTEAVEAGSHTVFIGRIVELHEGDGNALVYERARFHTLSPL